MKISIIYNSHSGTTEAFAEEIGSFFKEKNIEHKINSIDTYDKEFLAASDVVLLGCWTSGLFFFAQHPDKKWKKFALELPSLTGKSVALFTTYKLATGSMFKKMEAKLAGKILTNKMSIRARSNKLTDENRLQLEDLIQNVN